MREGGMTLIIPSGHLVQVEQVLHLVSSTLFRDEGSMQSQLSGVT